MKFIEGESRTQLTLIPQSLDSMIDKNSEVRVIDMFVNGLEPSDFDFYVKESKEGRPMYHPKVLLKLFIYGYLNKIRSSRGLEKECKRNVELMWLMNKLTPDHNTISNFRKENADGIKKVFAASVRVAKNFQLIGGMLLAGDSTKLRAQNSRRNNYNPKKVEDLLERLELKLAEYRLALMQADAEQKVELEAKINKKEVQKKKLEAIDQVLDDGEDEQLSLSDPESRMLKVAMGTEVGYSVQTITDDKHCIPVDYEVTNKTDIGAMSKMVSNAVEVFPDKGFKMVLDAGYHSGEEMKKVHDLKIVTIVSIPPAKAQAPDPKYNASKFSYNSQDHTYTCPKGQTLTTNGNWYDNSTSGVKYQNFTTKACKHCPVRESCTKSVKGKVIVRNENQQYVDQNAMNYELYKNLYKRRQAIIEHNFGTIKRQWGYNYILTKKGKKRASADVGFMFIAYVWRRIMNLTENDRLKEHLMKIILQNLAQVALKSSKIEVIRGCNPKNKEFYSFRLAA
jgi:transposase